MIMGKSLHNVDATQPGGIVVFKTLEKIAERKKYFGCPKKCPGILGKIYCRSPKSLSPPELGVPLVHVGKSWPKARIASVHITNLGSERMKKKIIQKSFRLRILKSVKYRSPLEQKTVAGLTEYHKK